MSQLKSRELRDKGTLMPVLDSLLHLLFPERCLICRAVMPSASLPPLCGSCLNSYAPLGRICPGCEKRIAANSACSCGSAGLSLQGLFALSSYNRQWRSLILRLKYYKKRNLARPLGLWLGHEIKNARYCSPAVVVPVPLHSARERERGYNQSSLIAGQTARYLGVSCEQLLIRKRETLSQTKISRRERRENIHGAFGCSKHITAGLTVLLIDDIYSTGYTLQEAASVLHERGAKVYGAVIAYNPRSG